MKVLNKKGLAACIAATSKDETRKSLTGVLIEPNGTCIGTDGYRMVMSRNCVEPFEGDAVMLIIDKMTAHQTNSDSECIIFIDGKESRLSFTGVKRSMIPVTIHDAVVPSYERLMATPCDKMNAFKFNVSMLSDIEKILNHGNPASGVRLSQEGDSASPICVEFDDVDTIMTLMPMRLS